MLEGTIEGTQTGEGTGQGTPTWVAQLPTDLKDNKTFTSYQTIGDLAKAHLELGDKVKEFDGMKAKLEDSIPRLPDDATDEDKNTYYDALGRPKKASEYEFDGEDKNAPEWTNFWKDQFHGLGLTKAQAKALSTQFNGQIQKMVDAHNTALKAEMTTAEQKLRTELGDKYDTNVELAKRVWQKHGEGEFDKMFSNETSTNRFGMVRFLLKMAALTGEDTSPQGGHSSNSGAPKPEDAWMSMYKNPVGR